MHCSQLTPVPCIRRFFSLYFLQKERPEDFPSVVDYSILFLYAHHFTFLPFLSFSIQARHPYTNIFRSQSFLLSRSQSSVNLFRKDSKHFFLNLIISKQQRKEILVLVQALNHGVFFGGCYPICNERCTRLLRQGFRHRY